MSAMADESTNSVPKRRQLRERTRKLYTDDWTLGDEDIEGRRSFQLDEKIECERYDLGNFNGLFREMTGPELTLGFLQKHGLQIPLLFKEKTGLGLRVPSPNFSINDVRTCVGSKRILDVMDVNTQKNEDMTMKEWQRYYEEPNKDRLLNVISLEFSHTRLENYVQSPTIVRQVDWVDVVWPRHLKEAQVEATNLLEDMMYPKVQKYCLMSVKGCYTDFHVDFGGTSVWYHILRGGKIFWLIPPTEKNLASYQQWVLSGKQSDVFFGDMVDRCGRINLTAGMTLFIPTGWIHAVYTPQDSLVFGGNFLHSFGIDKQLKVAQVEEHTKVPQKFRYPFFTEMLWYVLERYVHVLLDRSHLDIQEVGNQHQVTKLHQHMHLTPFELHGLKAIVMYLHSLPSTKKNVPELIRDPVALIHDVRCLVEQHRHDNPDAAVTGLPVLPPPPAMTIADRERLRAAKKSYTKLQRQQSQDNKDGLKESKPGVPRRRRTRCKKCEACTRSDCGECAYCQDMVKFGGTGRAKQTCLMRQCLRPMLPVTAACKVCQLDGWKQQPAPLMGKPTPSTPSTLMECTVCYDIVHPDCVPESGQGGIASEDLPNSWECPQCCESGRHLDYRPRHFKARARKISVSSGASSAPTTDSERATTPSKRSRPDPSEAWNDREPAEGEQRTALRTQLAIQLTGSTSKSLKRPHVVVRPMQLPLPTKPGPDLNGQTLVYDKIAMLAIFRFLSMKDLANCALVCRTWARFSVDPSLWKRMDMAHSHLIAAHLTGIARRQPENLCLNWTNVTKRQLAWLLGRLPQLRVLSLHGCAWSGVCALKTCACPPLVSLDLSHVSGLNDSSLREVLSPPTDSRPGLVDKTSRLKHLKSLSLAGCDITDIALRYIAQHLPYIEILDLSSCGRVSDAGVAQLTTAPAQTLSNLISLNLSNCRLLTEATLDHLARCKALKRLDLRHITQVSTQAVIRFAAKSEHNLHVTDVKLVEEKLIKVGGLRERDYQLAAQKRNEACRRFDYHCQTAKYFERESRLAHHFNSWSSRDTLDDKFFDDKKSKAEKLLRRQNNLRKLLCDEDKEQRNAVRRMEASRDRQQTREESVEELKKKLEIKKAERSLYYPHNYRCNQSCNGDSVTSCPRHYENERHIDACRNSQVSMEETNLRNYSSECQGRKENPENRHHGEKRHLQGHTIYGTNIDSFGEFPYEPVKHTGERRHYEAAVDNVDEGTNPHNDRGDADNVSVTSSGSRYRDEQGRSFGFSGQAPVSERRHYGKTSSDSFWGLADENPKQVAVNDTVLEVETEEERGAEEAEAAEREREIQELDEVDAEQAREQDREWERGEREHGDEYHAANEPKLGSPGSEGYDNKKNWSTDNINFSWKYDDPAKRPVCFLTHNQVVQEIQDLVTREVQACKKQNWSEALRLRDMRNRLELQREIEIFNQDDLNMNNEMRRSEMMKISDRIKLMDKREAGGNQHLIYSEEARSLWEARVREDDNILSRDDRAQREVLLKELEEEWEAMGLQDKERVAESPARHQKSHFQEELEINAAAMKKVVPAPHIQASNEDSKNSCTRNKDKGASSLIFLG